MDDLLVRFGEKYEKLYCEDAGAEKTGYALVTIRCDGYGATTKPQLKQTDRTSGAAAEPTTEAVYWPPAGERLDTAVYDHTDVHPGLVMDGPAVVRLRNTTVAVPPTNTANVDRYNNIIISE